MTRGGVTPHENASETPWYTHIINYEIPGQTHRYKPESRAELPRGGVPCFSTKRAATETTVESGEHLNAKSTVNGRSRPVAHSGLVRACPQVCTRHVLCVHKSGLENLRCPRLVCARVDLIAASIYEKHSLGPFVRPICTRCCFATTNMIQVCSNVR